MGIDNSQGFNKIIIEITKWTNAVLGVLVLLMVLFAIVKSVWIWFSVIKNSDSPDTRAIFLNALKWPFIAIIGVLVLIGISNIAIQIVKGMNLNINNA
ncbi:MAG: hypothetical protein E7Y34_00320 [Mycoplasma sp.]|nr:hypothetical protein [Mycoplasma sp.]